MAQPTQRPHQQAEEQHLKFRDQLKSPTPVSVVPQQQSFASHQVSMAEAALEAHLQQTKQSQPK